MAHTFGVPAKRLRRYSIAMASCLVFAAGSASAIAQQTETEIIANAGESYKTASELLLSWTIGEMAIETYSDGNIMLSQGFHQPKLQVHSLVTAEDFKNTVSVFPNPAVEYLTIELNESFSQQMRIGIIAEIHNTAGQLVFKGEFNTRSFTINMQEIANGSYVLQLNSAQQNLLGSYKIEKIK